MSRIRKASRRWLVRRLVSLSGVFGVGPATGPGGIGSPIGLLLLLTKVS